MPKLFGIRIDKLINDNVGPLFQGVLYQDIGGTRDPLNPTAGPVGGSARPHTFEGLTQFYRDNEVDNELILHEDRKVLIKTLSLRPAVVPVAGMRLTIEDSVGTFQVIRVNRDPASATYLCQVRL